jgi:hypothetical protein
MAMATDKEFFPPACVTTVSLRDIWTALFEALKVGAKEIEILGYRSSIAHESLEEPWFCFNLGEKKYAIWRATGNLYQVDATGAVADDPISGPCEPDPTTIRGKKIDGN